MLFEGSEKKLEVTMGPGSPHLLEAPRELWVEMVRAAGAAILSEVETDQCRAYLLSESSLFVWADRFTMITCGRTTLAKALERFHQSYSPDLVANVVYERKNEYYPRLQKTDFLKDVEILKKFHEGSSFRLGQQGEHHLYLFHSNKMFTPKASDVTAEVLMYHLQGEAAQVFSTPGQLAKSIREYIGLTKWFPQFIWDDFVFEPYGYSINGLFENYYVTIHITPQEVGSYVSFETNFDLGEKLELMVRDLVSRFQPLSFDVIHFRPDSIQGRLGVVRYRQVQDVVEPLSCGFQVQFGTYYAADLATDRATPMEV